MDRRLSILLLLIAFLFTGIADIQGKSPRKKSTLKKAKEHLRYEEYRQAIPHIQELLTEDERNPYYNYWMGKCLYLTYQKNQALTYFDIVNEENPDVDKDFQYFYGLTLHHNMRLDDAIDAYRKDLAQFTTEDPQYAVLANRISQASYAKRFQKKRDSKLVKISNMGDQINTEYSEHSPVISADNDILMFTARRPDSRGADPDKFYFDEDIYMARKSGDSWSTAKNIASPVNSKGHDATISLTADAKTLYIYRHKKAGGLYRTDFDEAGNKWNEPKAIEKPVNSKYYEASICQSADSSMLFFSSDRPGGYGGLDIYMVTREGKKWGEPENMGPVVNTPFNEDAPFIHPDGVTLYYSSNGRNSLGGYDIFVTELDESSKSWLPSLNMGPPVNTPDDEIYFVLSENGLTGYFASGREGGFGEKDIYQADFPYFRYPKRFYAMEIAGIVQDVNSLDTLPSSVRLIDQESGEVVEEVSIDRSSTYMFEVEPERAYSIEVIADGYEAVVEEFTTPELKDEDVVIERNVFVSRNRLEVPVEVIANPSFPEIQHVYFDFDETSLRGPAQSELNMIAEIMSQNENIAVKVSGHTDWFGTYEYNVALSQKRTSEVVDYLVSKGIGSDRINQDWFSENSPMEENDVDEGRQFNRRCEFKFIKDDGSIAFTSLKLRQGEEGPFVDRTAPKGLPGYDNPSDMGGTGALAPTDYGSPSANDGGVATWSGDSNTDATPVVSRAELPSELQELDLQHIYFDFDKSYLRSVAENNLEQVAGILKSNPSMVLNIKGHTDSFGSDGYNQRLSENRSSSAFDYLVASGVPMDQLIINGFSENTPIASNDNSTGRQSNRRVEFEIRDGNRILLRSTP